MIYLSLFRLLKTILHLVASAGASEAEDDSPIHQSSKRNRIEALTNVAEPAKPQAKRTSKSKASDHDPVFLPYEHDRSVAACHQPPVALLRTLKHTPICAPSNLGNFLLSFQSDENISRLLMLNYLLNKK